MESQVNWMRPLIEMQVRMIIAKARDTAELQPIGIKVEDVDNCVYTDDGSNFRAISVFDNLDVKPRVHLLKVSSVQPDHANIVIGDGTTKICAQLSADALLQLEMGIGEHLSLDMTGDVFSISRADIICTPYGLANDRIRLDIRALEYLYHLRRVPLGQAAIIETPAITASLEEISTFRQQRLLQFDENSIHTCDSSVQRSNATSTEDEDLQLTGTQWPASPLLAFNGVVSSTPDLLPETRRDCVSVTPSKTTANLNLDLPTATDLKETRAYYDQDSPPSSWIALPPQHINKQGDHTEDSKGFAEARSARSQSIFQEAGTPLRTRPEDSVLRGNPHSSTPEASAMDRRTPRRDNGSLQTSYRECHIASDQQQLLDQKAAWRPPLVGLQFPCPIVPATLLESWNARAHECVVKDNDLPLRSPEKSANWSRLSAQPDSDHTPADTSDFSSEEDSADESIELASCQDFQRSDLPPDSSLVSVPSPSARKSGSSAAIPKEEARTPKKPTSKSAAGDILLSNQERPFSDGGRSDGAFQGGCSTPTRCQTLPSRGNKQPVTDTLRVSEVEQRNIHEQKRSRHFRLSPRHNWPAIDRNKRITACKFENGIPIDVADADKVDQYGEKLLDELNLLSRFVAQSKPSFCSSMSEIENELLKGTVEKTTLRRPPDWVGRHSHTTCTNQQTNAYQSFSPDFSGTVKQDHVSASVVSVDGREGFISPKQNENHDGNSTSPHALHQHSVKSRTFFSAFAQAFVDLSPSGALAGTITKKNKALTIDVTEWAI